MDRVDIGIIRWFMQGQPTAPLRPEVRPMVEALSRRLGVTGETVRNRMRRMYDAGLLGPSVLHPNPSVLGAQMGAFGMFVPPAVSRPALARKLALVGGSMIVASHLDGMMGIVFIHEGGDSLDRKLELMKGLAGASDGFFTEVPFPPCRLDLTETDWRIISAMRPNASLSYGLLSKKLGISSRTVKRRLDRMVSGGAVFSLVTHDMRAVAGSVTMNMVVFYDPSASRPATDARILAQLKDILVFAGIWARYSVYAIYTPNLAAGQEVAQNVKRIRGVKDAWASVIEERLEVFEGLDTFIGRKLAESKAGGSAQKVPALVGKGAPRRRSSSQAKK